MAKSQFQLHLSLHLCLLLILSAFCRVPNPTLLSPSPSSHGPDSDCAHPYATPIATEIDSAQPKKKDPHNQGVFRIDSDRPDTQAIITRGWIECTKKCNYRPFGGNEGTCFGSFVSDCKVNQYFADDHMLETATRITCIGFFSNQTVSDGGEDLIETLCTGQFQQAQILRVYEAVIERFISGDEFVTMKRTETYYSSYSCRYRLHVKRWLKQPDPWKSSAVEGTVDVSCDATQNVQIQKGYCDCTEQACKAAKENEKVIQFHRGANETGIVNKTMEHPVRNEQLITQSIDQNFKLLAEHDPELAHRVASAIMDEISKGVSDGTSIENISPLIREYHDSQNLYAKRSYGEMPEWTSRPTTTWLHVFCNGSKAAFHEDCNGHFSANVNFASTGNAFILCKGDWRAYEDVTHVCSGVFTEDESESNDYGTSFSKVSSCSGTVAVSPVSTEMDEGIKFYGLSEICTGEASLRASYVLEDIDHRYWTQTVDLRTVEQIICLLADRTCEQLRFFTS